ncbi:AMP-dependent synthetase/ligase [Alicyclobacillus cellulosilyticus]|nr:long-chain fatty acid--CoA ligase [Alicyclobacillus cellulosilyticus]
MPSRSLVHWLAASAARHADAPALWDPVPGGGYRALTYRQFWAQVVRMADLLADLGVRPGDRVALFAASRAWWPVSDVAVMSLGAVTVPLDLHASPPQLAHVVHHAAPVGVVVDGAERLRQVLALPPGACASVRFAVVLAAKDDAAQGAVHRAAHGAGEDEGTGPTVWAAARARGWLVASGAEQAAPAHVTDGPRADVKPGDLATIVYTSGTTGSPKGVCLTHENLCANIEGIVQYVPLAPRDRTLSYLPLSHIFERTAGQFVPLTQGASIAYARSFAELPHDLRSMPPTVLTTVPRLLEKVMERIEADVARMPGWRRRLFQQAVACGAAVRVDGARGARGRLRVYDLLVHRRVRRALGGRLRMIIVGGAPLPVHVGRFFQACGIPVVEGYGLTETSPVVSVNLPAAPRLGTAGKVLPNVEVRLAPDGEIWVRGPSVTPGYYRDEAETRAAFTDDGWFKTGDIGEWVDGAYLRINDRKKHVLVLSTGKKVVPAPVEAAICRSPLIEQAVLAGHGRKFVSAIVVPSPAAEQAGLTPHTLAARLLAEVSEHTAPFADFERPKKIIVAEEPFSVENGLLTPTHKVRRDAVWARYAAEIDDLYANAPPDRQD